MSLLHLIHKNIVVKFSDSAGTQFNPDASYAFRLTGVDAMGFIQIQNLIGPSAGANPEPISDAYWINKDLIRELRELDLSKPQGTLTYTGVSPTPVEAKPPKAKKTALKPKAILN
jgi:hypothetical protein